MNGILLDEILLSMNEILILSNINCNPSTSNDGN